MEGRALPPPDYKMQIIIIGKKIKKTVLTLQQSKFIKHQNSVEKFIFILCRFARFPYCHLINYKF